MYYAKILEIRPNYWTTCLLSTQAPKGYMGGKIWVERYQGFGSARRLTNTFIAEAYPGNMYWKKYNETRNPNERERVFSVAHVQINHHMTVHPILGEFTDNARVQDGQQFTRKPGKVQLFETAYDRTWQEFLELVQSSKGDKDSIKNLQKVYLLDLIQ